MLLSKTYYLLKPWIPWSVRVAMRKWRARRILARCGDVWPIDDRAGFVPPGWPGWPDGKRCAFVLTHDVERTKGLRRVEQLMELEAKYGFRSSFNFVPESEYRVPDALRNTIERRGFETGVHGLYHDGKLYSSPSVFAERASRIRQYVEAWGAKGFRSPLMQHKLGWLHALGVEYDSSTFDTDPFEPQSDGMVTIFPFWVQGPDGSGYVELPYTLVQDFTLFLVLGQRNPDIWKQKLDWLVERGGMALLNTHPDYMCFGDAPRERDEFPIAHYEEFLRYARDRYGDVLWHALPREVNSFYRAALPPGARNSRRRICMIAHTHYETDNRVRRYAEALARRGDQVEVIALSTVKGRRCWQEIGGVRAFGIQYREHNERCKWTYAWRVVRFLFVSSLFLSRRHQRIQYDAIHVHNVPDFLVFAAWYPKWTGAKIILDVHDIVPELFASKFRAPATSRFVRLLKRLEKASAAFADHVIVSNHLWLQRMQSRSVAAQKSSVFVNHVDPAIFYRRKRTRDDGKFIILFPGSFQWHQGLDIAIRAFARLRDKVPHAEFHLYGESSTNGLGAELAHLAKDLGLNGSVRFCGGVTLDRMPEVIANADLGVVPKRADTFGNEAYSTKIMEFMSQGLPVVASRTRIDTFYFDDKTVRFFPSGDDKAMADAMLAVMEDADLRESLIRAGYDYVTRHGWDTKKNEYLDLVDSLLTEPIDCGSGARQPLP
jgi:glycosyltransferase involved in cell wall biosynthesis/peptidoglycan/xylan/chitin deacetylase (PgdA/CDA1 family)